MALRSSVDWMEAAQVGGGPTVSGRLLRHRAAALSADSAVRLEEPRYINRTI